MSTDEIGASAVLVAVAVASVSFYSTCSRTAGITPFSKDNFSGKSTKISVSVKKMCLQ